jgi:abortive infection alpha-like protein
MSTAKEDTSNDANGGGGDAGLIGTTVGLARISAFAYLRTAKWGAQSTARAASLAVRAARSGMSPADLFRATGADAREQALRVLGIEPDPAPDAKQRSRSDAQPAEGSNVEEEVRPTPLQERGADLLRRSADVHYDEEMHPAYERILGEISPDEGRILRLLAKGPQPAVDVRTSTPLNIGSELIEPGLTLIGGEAGTRHSDRVPAYLNNLFRLGLVWFSREAIKDRSRYQLLEAQPDVIEALKDAGRGKTIRRSVHLTPFGIDFCNVVMPAEDSPGGQE